MRIAFCLVNCDHGAMILNRFDYNYVMSGDFYGVGAQILEKSAYDPEDIACVKSFLTCRKEHFGAGVVAIDGGANVGVHALEWSRHMRGWGKVIAVEAQERVFYALAGNVALQNCTNVRALWAALGEEAGEIHIPEPDYTDKGSFGSFELKPRVGTENIGQEIDYSKPTSTVRQMTVDSLNLPRLDFLKLDVEGMEMEALDGANETIKRCRPILFVEIIKSNRMLIEAALTNDGYRCMIHGMNLVAVHETDPTIQQIMVHKVETR